MVKQDVENYVTANWGQHQETVTELSKEQKKGTSLVLSDTQMYNFDQITKEIYATRKNGIPTSADALTFSKNIFCLLSLNLDLKRNLLKCEGDNSRVLVDLWVIIDEEEIDYMEDTLASLANKTIEEKNNIFERIRKALNRFLRQQDANGNRYCYESIHVLSARDYENYLKTVEQEKGEVGLCT